MSVDSAAAQPATPDSLIARCLSGDQAAWEPIVRQHWRKVFNVAYKFVGRHDEAEDLTQDIFLKIFKALHTFDRRANFQTWLISISRNLCIDHYRSVRKERETMARDVDASDLQPVSSERGPYCRRAPGSRARCCAGRCSICRRRCGSGRASRPAGVLVSGDRRPAGVAGRHRQVPHQSRPPRAGAPAQTAAGKQPAFGVAAEPPRAPEAAAPESLNEHHYRSREQRGRHSRRRNAADLSDAVGLLVRGHPAHRRGRAQWSSICHRSATSTAPRSAA